MHGLLFFVSLIYHHIWSSRTDAVSSLILVPKAFGTPRYPDKNRDKAALIQHLFCLISNCMNNIINTASKYFNIVIVRLDSRIKYGTGSQSRTY
jgi:hypothetical protein